MAEEELEAFTGDQLWEPWLANFKQEVTGWKECYKHAHLCSLIQGEAAEFVFLELPREQRETYKQLVEALTSRYECNETAHSMQGIDFKRDNQACYLPPEEDWLQYAFHHIQVLMMEMEQLQQEVHHNRSEIQKLKQQLHSSNHTIEQMKQSLCQENCKIPPFDNAVRNTQQDFTINCLNVKPEETTDETDDWGTFISHTDLPDLIDRNDTIEGGHAVNVLKQMAEFNSRVCEESEVLPQDERNHNLQGNLLGPSHEEVVRWPTSGILLGVCMIMGIMINYLF
jgi:hypothetical protein